MSVKAPRVCLMIGQLGLGGTEKQVALLAAGLRERGLRVSVLAMFDGGPYEGELRAAGVPVVRLGFRRRAEGWRMAGGNLVAFARLVEALRRGRPDVLHAFLFHAYVTAAPAARLSGVPVLVAARRGLGGFKRGRPLAWAAGAVANRLTDHIAANSAAVARDARREPGARPGMISVIPNGLTADAFADVPPAEVDTALPVVLCVANLIAYKGHRHLIDAAALLKARGTPCTLLLAGDGPERAALATQAARLGVDVRLLGPRRDIPALLARADAVVLPSLEEGMSNALLEAMAAARPIVATAVGGTPELLVDSPASASMPDSASASLPGSGAMPGGGGIGAGWRERGVLVSASASLPGSGAMPGEGGIGAGWGERGVLVSASASLPGPGATPGGAGIGAGWGERGVLVPAGDAAALADGLGRVLGDPEAAGLMGRRAREWCRARLGAEAMVERHLELYVRLLERTRRRRTCAG